MNLQNTVKYHYILQALNFLLLQGKITEAEHRKIVADVRIRNNRQRTYSHTESNVPTAKSTSGMSTATRNPIGYVPIGPIN